VDSDYNRFIKWDYNFDSSNQEKIYIKISKYIPFCTGMLAVTYTPDKLSANQFIRNVAFNLS
jgi:hypothetical protein